MFGACTVARGWLLSYTFVMSLTSKSPRAVAAVALAIGERGLPRYAHRFAPQTFTQPHLLACLVLMRFYKTDYRGIVGILADNPTLCAGLGLTRDPHFTTPAKAQRRLIRFAAVRGLLAASVKLLQPRRRRIRRAAADATGFESSRISPYFVRRRDRSSGKPTTSRYTRFPKLHAIADTATHLILAAYPKRGPTPDVGELGLILSQLPSALQPRQLLADAGYDSEPNHQRLRDTLGIVSLIPPRIGRPSNKPATGKYRRLMQRLFEHRSRIGYGQRWQVETVFSMLKRNLGHAVAARSYHAQNRDMLLRCITHNIMILRRNSRAFRQSRSGVIDLSF